MADVKAARAAGAPALKSARPLTKVTTYVPHQQGYPAEFVALVETVKVDASGTPSNDAIGFYYRFGRLSEDASWKANFYVLASLDQPSRIAVGRDGFATMLAPGNGTLVVDPKQLPGSLAQYLNSGLISGSAEGSLGPGHP